MYSSEFRNVDLDQQVLMAQPALRRYSADTTRLQTGNLATTF